MRKQKKNNKKQDVMYEDVLNKIRSIQELTNNNIITYSNKSMVKVVLGGMCLVVAIIPNGLGFIFYPLGLSLLINGGIDIYGYSKVVKKSIKFAIWRYFK